MLLLLLRRRHCDLQHTVIVIGLCFIGVHTLRERDRAGEAAVESLAPIISLTLLFALLLPFTLDGERIIVDANLHILFLQSRQIGAHDELIASLEDLDLRCPAIREDRAHLSRRCLTPSA